MDQSFHRKGGGGGVKAPGEKRRKRQEKDDGREIDFSLISINFKTFENETLAFSFSND